MLQKHSLSMRVAASKIVGLLVGGLVFFTFQALGADFSLQFGLGVWLMYILMSLTIGFIGTFTEHPVVKMSLPFWIRGGSIGFSFHLMLVLLAYGEVQSIMTLEAFAWTGLSSPYWILIDGTILGVLIGWILTKYIGEGEMPVK